MSGIVTVVAPVNIAVVKYWGKRDEELIIPLNDSVSASLDTSVMCAKTSVCASPRFTSDEIWLNGKRELFTNNRLLNCLKEIKSRAVKEKTVDEAVLSWKVHIASENNFPTAAGLASSAAGYACLVTALAKLYKVESDVSSVARLGSGSACRSIFGGFVRWHAGINPNGTDSIAKQVAPASHWPEMRALILVIGDSKKKVSSTVGMKRSVVTSELLKYRAKVCVPQRTEEMCQAILDRNFEKFAEITMKESNQFHSICLDSYPPFVYMTAVSHLIVDLIHSYNAVSGQIKVAYTFDAGPNACLYLLEKDVPIVLSMIKSLFPSSNPESYVRGVEVPEQPVPLDLLNKLPVTTQGKDLINYIIHTKVGDGPTVLKDGPHLFSNDV